MIYALGAVLLAGAGVGFVGGIAYAIREREREDAARAERIRRYVMGQVPWR